ncbi:MAG: hypothetical protein KGD63_04385 [Candidatus Lokiarchaeota archaeon]|nr:hypothetical protein [Candidatus Lokiarchaeota archaeon]
MVFDSGLREFEKKNNVPIIPTGNETLNKLLLGVVYYLKQADIVNKLLNYRFIVDGEFVDMTKQKTFAQIVEESRASSFTIMSVQVGAAKEFREENVPLYRGKVSLKGYEYLYNKLKNEHANEEIYKDILKYSSIILDMTLEEAQYPLYNEFISEDETRRTHEIYGDKDYLDKSHPEFNLTVNDHIYEALIYKIRVKEGFPNSWFEGKLYVGYSIKTIDMRFAFHILKSIRQELDFQSGKRINPPTKSKRVIIIALEDILDNLGKDLKQLEKIFKISINENHITDVVREVIEILKKNYFEIFGIEVHKSLEKAKQREKEIIDERDLINQGLNEKTGGTGGLEKYISYPLYDIIGLMTLGANQKDILSILGKFYPKITRTTFQNRIKEYFISLEDAKISFLKPLIEALILEGYDGREIFDTLLSKNPQDHGILSTWFREGIELDFSYWENIMIFDNVEATRLRYKDLKRYFCIERSLWEEWVLEGISQGKIAKANKLAVSNVGYVYKNKFGGYRNYLYSHRMKKTIELLGKEIDFKEIYEDYFKLNYFNIRGRESFEIWFNGDYTLEQIKELYYNPPN